MAASVLLAIGIGHLFVALTAAGPVAVPDVPAYLSIAQWIGGDGLAPTELPYQPGYGLLLAPLVAAFSVWPASLLGTSGELVHHLALAVNAIAATAAAATAGWLGLRCTASRRAAVAAAMVAAVHPSLSSASQIAWPEALLGLWVLLIALAVARAVSASASAAGRRSWVWAGLLAAVSVALHARMVMLVVAVIVTALVCGIGRRNWAGLGAGLLVGGSAAAAALSLTGTWPTARLGEATQFDRGAEPILTVAGQLLALGGGTLGLGLLGLLAGLGVVLGATQRLIRGPVSALAASLAARWHRLRWAPLRTVRVRPGRGADLPRWHRLRWASLRTRRPSRRWASLRTRRPSRTVGSPLTPLTPWGAAAVVVAVGACGSVLLGGWTLTGSDRADVLLYGRYVDPWAVPLVVVALCWLAKWRQTKTTPALHPSAPESPALHPSAPESPALHSSVPESPALHSSVPESPALHSSVPESPALHSSVPESPALHSSVPESPAPESPVLRALIARSAACGSKSPLRAAGAVVAASAVVALISCALVVAFSGSYDAAPRRIMTLSFSPAWLWSGEQLWAVAVAAVGASLLGVLTAAATLRSQYAGSAGLATLVVALVSFGVVAAAANHRHLAEVGAVARDQVVAAQALGDAIDGDGLSCLAHDQASVRDYALWLYRLELPQIAHERVDLDAGDPACSELVIAHDRLAERCTNAQHQVAEPAATWALWHLRGRSCTPLR